MARAASQLRLSALPAAMRAHPDAKAASPGASRASVQPGISEKAAGVYFASGPRTGAGQAGQSAQGGHARWPLPPAGSSAQPAATRIAIRGTARARTMWVIYLEMGLALALAI